MFKKLLTVGTLAAALIGGIGTASASASTDISNAYYGCYEAQYYDMGGTEVRAFRTVVYSKGDIIAGDFNENGYTWYIISNKKDCGDGKYVVLYANKENPW
ncbi:hypothetical protein [Xenorhabdus sp. SGI246]|uniref:hypothetical protein n=1 Tax=Xenorhabdus sp. SGI246 TaxID=3158263 RepID=UPI00349F4123